MGTVIRIRRHILSASELLARLTRKVISNIGHVLTYGLCCLCSLATYGRINGPLKGFVRSGHLVFLTGWVRQCAGAVQERDYTNLNCCGMFRTLKSCGDIAALREFARLGGEDILSTAMIVGEANPLVGGVHDRMPVMLMSDDYDRWLDAGTSVDDLKAMLKPYDPALMEAYAVNRAVNNVKNDTEECIEPMGDRSSLDDGDASRAADS